MQKTVSAAECEEVNPKAFDYCEDMASLSHLSDACVLYNLRMRFKLDLIHVCWFEKFLKKYYHVIFLDGLGSVLSDGKSMAMAASVHRRHHARLRRTHKSTPTAHFSSRLFCVVNDYKRAPCLIFFWDFNENLGFENAYFFLALVHYHPRSPIQHTWTLSTVVAISRS
jgi:hypothetical protein